MDEASRGPVTQWLECLSYKQVVGGSIPPWPTMQKMIVVCGGRDFDNYQLLESTLNPIIGIAGIISGGAKGADSLAKEYARINGIPFREFKADWKLGKSAGPKRNKQMLDFLLNYKQCYELIVIAMPGGKGAANMVKLAKDNNIQTIEVI